MVTMSGRRMSRRVINADERSNIYESIYWNEEEVADWVERVGFPQYKECFVRNFVTGRKLIAVDAAALPSMGICDFGDIKRLAKLIRELIGVPKLHHKREVAMRDSKVAYLELKRRTGHIMDNTTYNAFVLQHANFFPNARLPRQSF